MHIATQAPAELRNFILPLIVTSATVGILIIAIFPLLMAVCIRATRRKKSGRVAVHAYSRLFVHKVVI